MSTSSTPYLPRIETIVALLQPASRGSTHKRGQTRPILSFLSCCAFFLVVLVSLLSSSVSTTVQASGVQFALAGGYVDQPRERSRALFTAHVDLSIAPCAHSLRSVPPLLRSVDPVGLPRCRCLISRPHHIHTAPLTHSLTHSHYSCTTASKPRASATLTITITVANSLPCVCNAPPTKPP
jgi:hypothetical protein